jgi:rhodanese-related sulfurtransferase
MIFAITTLASLSVSWFASTRIKNVLWPPLQPLDQPPPPSSESQEVQEREEENNDQQLSHTHTAPNVTDTKRKSKKKDVPSLSIEKVHDTELLLQEQGEEGEEEQDNEDIMSLPDDAPIPPHIAEQLIQEGDVDIIIDCRTDEEWKQGHHPQAVHLPLTELETMQALPSYFDDDARILTTCVSGERAQKAADILRTKFGLENVVAVSGTLVS